MNRIACFICGLILIGSTVAPSQAAFVNGNLVILTTDGNASTAASTLTLNEYPYNPATGTFGTTPTSHSISGITLPAESDHDGLLRQSTSGGSLVFGGYQAAPGTPSVIASAAPRTIAVVDANWNVSTVPVSGYTGLALRSVVSTDGQHFWTGGDQGADGGQYYIDASGPTTQTQTTANDARGNRINDGQLWGFSSGTGGSKVGAGLPTGLTTQTAAMTSPFIKSDAIFLDLNNDGVSETAYSTDGKNLLGKWNYDGNTWTLTGQWSGSKTSINDINSLEAFIYNGNVELLAATQLGQLFQFTDTNGILPNFDPDFLSNTVPVPFLTMASVSFRGMAITVPEPTTWLLLAVALPLFAWGNRGRIRRCAA
jgi:hypothetical protein